MEVFSGGSLCAGCVAVLELADVYAERHKGKLEVIRFIGDEATSRFGEYGLGCVPALVINKTIRVDSHGLTPVALERRRTDYGAFTPGLTPWVLCRPRAAVEIYDERSEH